jgi:superfamily II DNA/RNA helicase
MSKNIKKQTSILTKLGINKLNPMQEEAHLGIRSSNELVLLSPTGTGKTVAFLVPVILNLDLECSEIQVIIVVPTRELAIQIEQVAREMGTGHKINAVYGGRTGSRDRKDIKHRPAILIGTPGRIADHLRRKAFDTRKIHTLILDEFDKSLEVGFEQEMRDIISIIPKIQKKILTSATDGIEIPDFVGLREPIIVDYLDQKITKLKLKTVLSPSKDKLTTLVDLLSHIGNQEGIIFCNFKSSIQRISDYLSENNISHGYFYGGMEQVDRERALIKFRNGTYQILLATDLAARGIDVPEIKFIIHYHLPIKSQEFTHRNGRTARMNSEGTAYVLQWSKEELPDFIQNSETITLKLKAPPAPSKWKTLFISGGRKDKISKGDIAGLFFKVGKLNSDQLGIIELKNDCAFVAVKVENVFKLTSLLTNTRLKKKKIRVTVI